MSMDNLNRIAGELQSPSVGMDRLAQYAQGTNPLIPQYMALAEIQRRQDLTKLEPGQASTTTVAQDLVSKALAPQTPMGGMQGMTPQTAPQQAPQGVAGLQAPQGVAALPSGMGQQSFAGGGIVAFDEGSKDAVKDPNADTSTDDNAYLNRSRGLVEGVKNLGSAFTNPRNYDPITKLVLDPTKAVQNWGQTPVGEQAAQFRDASNARDNVSFTNTKPNANKVYSGTQDQEDRESPARTILGQDPTKQMAEPGVVSPAMLKASLNQANVPTGAGADTGAGARTGAKAADAAAQLGIKQTDTGSDMFGKYQKLYDEQRAQAAADKEQSKWMRLLEAGLGIMGGTSQYALTNIAQGALPAAKGAASDIATYRKDTADANKELALLNMKQQEIKNDADKTGITQQHYQDWARIEQQKNGILAANGASSRAGIAEENRIMQAYKVLSAKPENMGKSEQDLYAMARTMVTGADQGGGTNTVSWGDLTKKKS